MKEHCDGKTGYFKTKVFALSLYHNTENNGRAKEDLRTSMLREDRGTVSGPSNLKLLGLLPVS